MLNAFFLEYKQSSWKCANRIDGKGLQQGHWSFCRLITHKKMIEKHHQRYEKHLLGLERCRGASSSPSTNPRQDHSIHHIGIWLFPGNLTYGFLLFEAESKISQKWGAYPPWISECMMKTPPSVAEFEGSDKLCLLNLGFQPSNPPKSTSSMWKYLCRTAAGHLLLLSLREVKAAGIILEVIGLGFVDHLRAMTAMSMEVSVAAIRGDHDQDHH